MSMRTAILCSLLVAAAIAACVGSDPDVESASHVDAGSAATSSSSSSSTGGFFDAAPNDAASSGDAASDATTEAAVDSGPTCKETVASCHDYLNAQMKNDCTTNLASCQAPCGTTSSTDPCVKACRTTYNTCAMNYQKQCLDCEKDKNVCDSDKDCQVVYMQ
jgi:hypothetical protein